MNCFVLFSSNHTESFSSRAQPCVLKAASAWFIAFAPPLLQSRNSSPISQSGAPRVMGHGGSPPAITGVPRGWFGVLGWGWDGVGVLPGVLPALHRDGTKPGFPSERAPGLWKGFGTQGNTNSRALRWVWLAGMSRLCFSVCARCAVSLSPEGGPVPVPPLAAVPFSAPRGDGEPQTPSIPRRHPHLLSVLCTLLEGKPL